jgi:hypothetical protein
MNVCSRHVSIPALLLPAKQSKLSDRLRVLSLEFNLTIALLLMLASALVGMATGFVFKIWALVLISPLVAIFCAIVLRASEFGLVAGVTVIAVCLAVCQLAYLAAAYLRHARDISSHDEVDGEPGETSEHKIRPQHK